MMVEENEYLRFYHPEAGFNLFIDAFCIPSCAPNKEGAEAYINFLLSPEICGQNLEYLGYSTPCSESKNYMDPEVAASGIAYPPEEVVLRGQSFLALDTETTQLMDSLWLEVKTDGNHDYAPIIGISTVIGLVAAFTILRSVKRKRRIKRRGTYTA